MFNNTHPLRHRYFKARDGGRLHTARYGRRSPHTILLLHGVGASGAALHEAAGRLQQATGAEVYALDLRGHGRSAGRAGDVDYIGQYADDVADVAAALRRDKPRGKLVLAGHSMGGGIALLYGQQASPRVDGLLLLAPLLGHDSPALAAALPPAGPDSANASGPDLMHVHIGRIIGLKMLNSVQLHQHDSLPVLFLNVPPAAPLRHYSYRANASMAPEHYAAGLRAVTGPLLVLVGGQDEVFAAEAQHRAVQAHSRGQVEVVAGASHNGLCREARTFQVVREWFARL
ncbi:alpha/beta hydrolase [Hymenobacter sp. J193]|uniref:alpha/beta hydrolase n=1 Tax=Hymenobacter sp. J193 TaxID=2898429 RepID=UPI0021514FC5|nr:lysophospholipase [Hymenobacter sp. J193]MCR5890786.1 alpha/beta hydrolase [Hymenobacter sp. J193]